MSRRLCLLAVVTAVSVGLQRLAWAQAPSADADALRRAISKYFVAWNHHDPAAWAEFLTQDIQWVFPYSNLKTGREVVAAYGATSVRSYDAKFEVAKLKLYDGGSRATVVLRGQFLELPVRDGKYARVWDRDPLLSRWRLEGATWRMYYMNEHVPEAADLAKAEGLH